MCMMEPSASSSHPPYDHQLNHLPLIPGLPNDLALSCLARIPRKYHSILNYVSRGWRNLLGSEEWMVYRQKNNLGETWMYALCKEMHTDEVSLYVVDPSSSIQGCWKAIPVLPSRGGLKRKGMALETIGNKLYLLGGCDSSGDATNEVYCFNAGNNSWGEAPSMPTARCYFGCETMNGKIFAIGGYGQNIDSQSWDLYDPSTNSWESDRDRDPNIILDKIMDSVVMDGKIFIRSRTLSEPPHLRISIYEPSSNNWEQMNDTEMTRGWRGPAIVVGDNMYTWYGSLGNELMMWNKKTEEWEVVCGPFTGSPRPPCEALVAIGRNIVVIGKGLSTLVLNVDEFGDFDSVIKSTYSTGLPTSLSASIWSSYLDVIACHVISI